MFGGENMATLFRLFGVLGCDTTQSCRKIPAFQRNSSLPLVKNFGEYPGCSTTI
jgi:hypothetical protein